MSVIDIDSMLELIVRGFAPLVKEKGLRVEWHVDPSLPPLHTDLRKLTMILTNLVDNAVKYTEQGGGDDPRVRRRATHPVRCS